MPSCMPARMPKGTTMFLKVYSAAVRCHIVLYRRWRMRFK